MKFIRSVRLGRVFSLIFGGASLMICFQNCGKFQTQKDVTSAFEMQQRSSLMQKTCSDPSAVSKRDSQRLNRIQYINVLTDIFGVTAVNSLADILVNFPDDRFYEYPSQFDASFNQGKVDTFFEVAKKLGTLTASTVAIQTKLGADCISTAPSDACYSQFIASLGSKAFRRPLTPSETTALKAIANAGTTREQKVSGVIEAVLQSPRFLYQIELGGGIVANSIVTLTPYEIAARLSFMIWDSIPDQELSALAANGEIRKPAVQKAQADRMFAHSKARPKIERFAMYWLGQNSGHAMSTFPTSPPEFVAGLNSTALRAETLRELQEFVKYQVLEKKGTFSDLLTSTDSFARTDDLASIFGHPKVTGSTPATMAGGRRGVLMRPVFMAHAQSTPSSILRGVRIRARMFCGQLGAPPAGAEGLGVDITTPEMIKRYSNRELITMKTSTGSCFGCHSQANPIGFAFESLDSFGRFRMVEKIYQFGGGNSSLIAEHRINSESTPSTGWGEYWSVSGPEHFSQMVAESQTGVACFSRHVYEYLQVQDENAEDGCLLTSVIEKVNDPNQGILEAMKDVVLSNYLIKKKIN